MNDVYRVPLHIQVSRRFLRVFFRTVFHLLGRVERSGFENMPENSRYVIVFNHVSLVEVPFILAFWPAVVEIIGAAAVWTRPGQSLLAQMWAAIRLKRTEFDREVFKQTQKVIQSGRPLMISPEGGRSHTPGLRRGKPGVAYIIDQADVVIVPVAVVGNTMDFLSQGLRGKRPTIRLIVGRSFRMPSLTGRGEERRALRQHHTDQIMARLAALLPEEYRGVYSDYESILAGDRLPLPDQEPGG